MSSASDYSDFRRYAISQAAAGLIAKVLHSKKAGYVIRFLPFCHQKNIPGTDGTEYFYFKLDFYGDFLLGYAKTQDGPESPVVAKAVK